MTEQFQSVAHYTAQERINTWGIDVGSLSPKEVVDVYRYAWNSGPDAEVGTPWEEDSPGLAERLDVALTELPKIDLERAKEIFTAFAESPVPGDRTALTNYSVTHLTQADHDTGVVLWDRLMRDSDKNVRDAAEQMLHEMLHEAAGPPHEQDPDTGQWLSGMHFIARLDEAQLRKYTGLTRQDAYSILESYAYAENGQYVYDLGREALRKLIAAQPEQAQAASNES